MKRQASSIISLLVAIFLIPLPASAEPVCEGTNCTITFGYTGSVQSWEIPQGAINISFEAFGASGARGGAGGSVTGRLIDLPQTLYIYVGGAGNQGVTAAGGYNGGGRAGGNRGNEGSGGGATDIRIGTELEDRIVVAGGGGGGGGYSGAAGAAGGGLTANSGASGQGGGGGGGTQISGGGAGYSNGGSAASAGSFGQGGQGGTSWNAGGGGGGGGWYGGGGGGGDDDDCCADGGGGGGGSSYAASSQTENVEHQIGVNTGHGRLVITYSLAPTVVDFSGVQISAATASFTLEMSEQITEFTAEDLEVSSQSCEVGAITTDNDIASIELTGCSDGEITLTLLAFSIGPEGSGPPSPATATIDFDGIGPDFNWQLMPSAISSSEITIAFTVSDEIEPLSSSFQVENCELTMTYSAVVLSSCSDGQVEVWLDEFTLFDSWGNAGPLSTQSVSFVVDTLAPAGFWSEVVTIGNDPFSYSTTLSFSEPVSFSPELVTFFSEQECDVQSSETPLGWLFEASCGYGSGSWALDTSELTDSLGNTGNQGVIAASFNNLEPIASEPEPEPAPEVVATPPAPAPTPAPLPPISEPVAPEPEQAVDPEPVEEVAEPEEVVPVISSESATASEQATEIPTASAEVDEVAQIEAELEREISTQPIPAPSKSSEAEETATQVVEPEQASEPATESESVSAAVLPVQPPALAEQVLFNDEPDPQPFPWFFALGAGLLLAAGVAALRLSGR